MINYIKMDLYKLFKGKTIYVCMVIFALLLSTTVIEIKDTEKNGKTAPPGFTFSIGKNEDEKILLKTPEDYENLEEFKEGFEDRAKEYTTQTTQTGIGMDANSIVEAGTTLESWMYSIYKGNLMIQMLLIVIAIFVCNDFSGGYIKNTINIPKHKWYANISKMVTAIVIFIMENIISALVYLFSYIFVFEKAKIGSITNMLPYIGVELLLYMGMVSAILLICNFTKSKAAGIVVGMLLATQMISGIASIFFGKIFGIKALEAMKCFMSSMATIISPDMSNALMKEAIILGTVGTVIYFILSNIVITKKDF